MIINVPILIESSISFRESIKIKNKDTITFPGKYNIYKSLWNNATKIKVRNKIKKKGNTHNLTFLCL